MLEKSMFQIAVEEGTAPGGNWWRSRDKLGYHILRTSLDASVVCELLSRLPATAASKEAVNEPRLHDLIAYVLGAEGEAKPVFQKRGLPQLYRLFDSRFGDPLWSNDLSFMMYAFAKYETDEGIDRIVRAARENLYCYLWFQIFGFFGQQRVMSGARQVRHSQFERLYEQLRDPLPRGHVEIPFLDWINTLAREDGFRPHAYDTDAGVARLGELLSDPDPSHGAVAAVVALPFIEHPLRDHLLKQAHRARDHLVRIESGWAAGVLGYREGPAVLTRYAADPRYTNLAIRYLHQIGRPELTPEIVVDPNFEAVSQMSWQLQNPEEYGRVPDRIELFDTREIFWPAAKSVKRLWLVKYVYNATCIGGSEEVGVGLVGALYPKYLKYAGIGSMSAMDIYALYCCSELQCSGAPNAPDEVSVDVGRRLLNMG